MKLVLAKLDYGAKYSLLPDEYRNKEFLQKHKIELKGKEKSLYVESLIVLTMEEFVDLNKVIKMVRTFNVETNLSNEMLNKIENAGKYFDKDVQFNSKVNVYQPNNPLFTFNVVQCIVDACTERLQTYLDENWSIITVCPQPNQRRPDYILGKYDKEKEST